MAGWDGWLPHESRTHRCCGGDHRPWPDDPILRRALEAKADQQAEADKQNENDRFWLGMARYIADEKSKDPSTKVGAVIVRDDNTIASFGYNGFPRGMDDSPERYADREFKYSRVVHAEMNAILNAKGPVKGYTMYLTFLPCDRCAVFVAQAGIKRVVAPAPTEDQLTRWADSLEKAKSIFAECGVEVSVLT